MRTGFWRDLNCYLPILAITGGALSGMVGALVAVLLAITIPSARPVIASVLSGAIVAVALVFLWKPLRLSAKEARPERESRFRIGHLLLAIANIAIVVSWCGPILVSFLTGNPNYNYGLFLAAIVLFPAGFMWIAGLIMVYSSRA
jgi:hypothetical protein